MVTYPFNKFKYDTELLIMPKKRKKTRKKKSKKRKSQGPKRMAEKEIKLLEQGYVPKKTKIGSGFKGKNKIIVAED